MPNSSHRLTTRSIQAANDAGCRRLSVTAENERNSPSASAASAGSAAAFAPSISVDKRRRIVGGRNRVSISSTHESSHRCRSACEERSASAGIGSSAARPQSVEVPVFQFIPQQAQHRAGDRRSGKGRPRTRSEFRRPRVSLATWPTVRRRLAWRSRFLPVRRLHAFRALAERLAAFGDGSPAGWRLGRRARTFATARRREPRLRCGLSNRCRDAPEKSRLPLSTESWRGSSGRRGLAGPVDLLSMRRRIWRTNRSARRDFPAATRSACSANCNKCSIISYWAA